MGYFFHFLSRKLAKTCKKCFTVVQKASRIKVIGYYGRDFRTGFQLMEEVIMDNNVRCEMSQSESLIMDYLWKNDGGKGFSEIMEYLNGEMHKNWKKQTINTFIRHLIDKGLISADVSQKSRRYSAALTPAQYACGKANKILADYYEGSVDVFLSALTGGKQLSKNLADELHELIEGAAQK